MKNFSIIIPVFNEEKNIDALIDEIYMQNFQIEFFEIIIVNDYSNDNTKKIIEQKKRQNNNIIIVNNSKNLGQSFSIHQGAKISNFDTIVTMDGDCQNDPADIEILLKEYFANNFHLVGGIRKKRRDTVLKIFSSKIANFIRKLVLKDECPDTGCGLKVLNKKILLQLPFFNGIHRFYPAFYRGLGFNCKYMPVSHRYRIYGKSKYGLLNRLFRGIFDLFRVYYLINKMRNNG